MPRYRENPWWIPIDFKQVVKDPQGDRSTLARNASTRIEAGSSDLNEKAPVPPLNGSPEENTLDSRIAGGLSIQKRRRRSHLHRQSQQSAAPGKLLFP